MTHTATPESASAGAARIGGPGAVLDDEQIRGFVRDQLAAVPLDGRSVCVIVPDGTRSCPLPLLLSAVHGALQGRVTRLTVLVALGTHAEMDEPALAAHLGYPGGGLAEHYPGMSVRNHEWWDPDTFVSVGRIGAERIAELSRGMLRARRRGPHQPRRRRARRHADRRPGVPARGRRVLRRQQVPVPGRVGPGADRRLPLARRADHQRRDHRHPRHHAGPRADRRGRLAGARRAVRVLPGGAVRVRQPARGRLR